MHKRIAVIAGDGIGPEITQQGMRVLETIAQRFGHSFAFEPVLCGGAAVDQEDDPLPPKSLQACMESDSVLLGAVGGPKWDGVPKEKRPEKGLLRLRSGMGLYANLRPARLFSQLAGACPLKDADGIDMLVVRELTGGIYFGEHSTQTVGGELRAKDVMEYSQSEILRIARLAFDAARRRRNHVTSVDKANVLDTSRLWRAIVTELAKEYPDVILEHMLVDNAAMQLVQSPQRFDVMLSENMFGDILSDEAGMITGSIGMLPSASMGDGTRGLFEPIHGSAPDIAGRNIANPIGTILSCAMMLEYSFGMGEEGRAIGAAVEAVLNAGYRTADIWVQGCTRVSCSEMGDRIVAMVGGRA